MTKSAYTSSYVGNLSPSTTQEEIRKLFEQYVEVESADLITDKYSGEPRGFGFVKMGNQGAREAIAALQNQAVGGRKPSVSDAIPRESSGRPNAAGRTAGEVIGSPV